MTTPELPPLPDSVVIDTHIPTQVALYGYTRHQMHAYAESARAPLVAEVERLREALQIALQHVPLEGDDADAIYKLVKP